MTPLLDIRALHSGYGRVEVLRGVDLQVGAGEIESGNRLGQRLMTRFGSKVWLAKLTTWHSC